MDTIVRSRLDAALATATQTLLAELNPQGHWTGELSSSALSTATAVVALGAVDRAQHGDLIAGGLQWLARHQNADGGWGDTVKSRSNISTTALCWAALSGGASTTDLTSSIANAEVWLTRAAGSLLQLVPAIERRYGKDRTFSVPILMHLAICGQVSWTKVSPLPFELAALPHQLFGALQLPVVSYALPALIAIGQAIHYHAPSANPLVRLIRESSLARTLRVLESIQPENGGFLEATPLTSFVTMALASAGHAQHPVARRAVNFLRASAQADGSWAIDTNLATWVTTLAIKALAHQPGALTPEQQLALREWLLGQQYRVEHPYTHAAPGGWAWTDLPGGVPDADDTPGALLALLHLGVVDAPTRTAGQMGVRWLIDLQNRDGGIPTFCRGWGALPFDRSSPDLTAHTLRAWTAWLPQLDDPLKKRTLSAVACAVRFLQQQQRPDGSWLPLWFGNEHAPDDENPVYGTAKIVIALRDLLHRGHALPEGMLERALRWLVERQDASGGWSGAKDGPVSVEETALAVEALASTEDVSATDRGTAWLVAQVESGRWSEPAPIGFYFAKLWYYERLYPLIWTVGALGKAGPLNSRD
ncbi:MAG: prenyltransferase/squalene oxidase repeat-containing protein [Chthoniobacter sp.]|uniref:prenyltransferase/squalene oxidase repeat-containing protein n=1 Tax=Chthoniobacter sp. TaxID=2510640 RepID=UPI0032AC1637